MTKIAEQNCLDIVGPLIPELNRHGLLAHFQLMGGIGSAVLKHSGTEIFPDEQLIVASGDFLENNADLCAIRPNGTLRDLDALVLIDDPSYISEVEAVTREVVGSQLEISVFGLRSAAHLREQREHPYGIKSLKTFLSDRYVDGRGAMQKALTPFAVPLPSESMESWTALVGERVFPVMNPAASLINYASRSISGVRPKDADKVEAMAAHVAGKWPGAAEWLNDGPGRSQVELARIFHTLRWGTKDGQPSHKIDIGGLFQLSAGSVPELRTHGAFMFKDVDAATQRRVLGAAVFKARLLGTAESNPTIVRLFQKFAERKLDTVTKNQ